MTQNTEQKVRTREDLVADLADCLAKDGSGFHKSTIEYTADSFIAAAEARGAAEQRRKDVEGQEPVVWENPDQRRFLYEIPVHSSGTCVYFQSGWRPLYTRPANVAALEARVKELEAENAHQRNQILELRNDDQRIRIAAEQVCSERYLSEILQARIALRAALTRGGDPA